MSTNSDITGDRITNALKGDKQKYRDNWDKIFKGKDMKKHVEQITGDTPHTVVEDDTEEILDEITQRNEEIGLYGEVDLDKED